MTTKEAIQRVVAETYLFTDRPDYTRPPSLIDALAVLYHEFQIDPYQYPKDEE